MSFFLDSKLSTKIIILIKHSHKIKYLSSVCNIFDNLENKFFQIVNKQWFDLLIVAQTRIVFARIPTYFFINGYSKSGNDFVFKRIRWSLTGC